MALARIGIGSNAGDSRATIARAIAALSKLGAVTARSALYRSKPWGKAEQPDFINAAVLLETALSPRNLLSALKTLETQLGRRQTYRWGPREIDLDILAYDDLCLCDPELTLPHPHLFKRAFALVPLAEIDAHYVAFRDALSPRALAEVTAVRGSPAIPDGTANSP